MVAIDTYSNDDLITLGSAAEILLKQRVVRDFFEIRDRQLFAEFCKLNPETDTTKMREIVLRQNSLAELLSYLQELGQHKEILTNRLDTGDGNDDENKEEGGRRQGGHGISGFGD